MTEYLMSAYISILYQRNLTSKYEKEFSALQLECESLLEKTSKLYDVVDKANQSLENFFHSEKKLRKKRKWKLNKKFEK